MPQQSTRAPSRSNAASCLSARSWRRYNNAGVVGAEFTGCPFMTFPKDAPRALLCAMALLALSACGAREMLHSEPRPQLHPQRLKQPLAVAAKLPRHRPVQQFQLRRLPQDRRAGAQARDQMRLAHAGGQRLRRSCAGLPRTGLLCGGLGAARLFLRAGLCEYRMDGTPDDQAMFILQVVPVEEGETP